VKIEHKATLSSGAVVDVVTVDDQRDGPWKEVRFTPHGSPVERSFTISQQEWEELGEFIAARFADR
jgi:hypothetical protein